MNIERFEDIEVWQPIERLVGKIKSSPLKSCRLKVERLASELTRKVYRLTKKPGFVMKRARRSTVNPWPRPDWASYCAT